MNIFQLRINNILLELQTIIKSLPIKEQIALLNDIKLKLHSVSPFMDEPTDCVLWIKNDNIESNDYNPNDVAPPEMRLLKLSIDKDHYTQPIVTWKESEDDYGIVDGEHRYKVGTSVKSIRNRLHNYLPITIVNQNVTDKNDRVSSTIRHNRARGVHKVMSMTDIVAMLIKNGWDDIKIATELGMDSDEILRFKQNTGLPELFKDHEYSKSWE